MDERIEIDWDGAIARVRAGEPFATFAGQPGMPTAAQWRQRLRTDRAFSRTVLEAAVDQNPDELESKLKRRRQEREAARITPEQCEVALQRIAAGESLFKFKREVGIANDAYWWSRRAIDPEFDARVKEAMGRRPGRRSEDADFDQALEALSRGEATKQLSQCGVLAVETLRTRCRSDAIFAAKYRAALGRRRGVPRTPEEFDAALLAIRAGARTDELSSMGHPSATTVHLRASRDPEFRRRYERALAERPQSAAAYDVSYLQLSLSQNSIYAMVAKAVPRWLDPDDRSDIISDIVLAVLAGDIDPDEVSEAWCYFKGAHNTSRALWQGSLDAPMYEDRLATFGDMVHSDADHW